MILKNPRFCPMQFFYFISMVKIKGLKCPHPYFFCMSLCEVNMKPCVSNVSAGHLYPFYPSNMAGWNKLNLEAAVNWTCGLSQSCHHLTSRRVDVMATCRDLSKLALRHAPAECLHTRSSHISRHQMDFRDRNESTSMTQSSNHP